jgi:hypothetical protein
MERTSGMKKGLRMVVTSLFLMAALASTGCTGNTLMGPSTDTAQDSGVVANQAGHGSNPAGHGSNP